MIVSNSMFPLGSGFRAVSTMQAQMADLQTQMATGKRVNSLSDLGSDRTFDLNVRARLSRIEGFQSNVQQVELRLSFMSNAIERLDAIEADSRAAVTIGGAGADDINVVTSQTLAEGRLNEVVSLMNSEVNGRYLFGGSTTDAAPVESLDAILNGSNGRDGFRTIVTQRKLADAGADGLGRLATSTTNSAATTTSSLGGDVDGSEFLSDAEIGFADNETFTLTGGGFAPVSITFDTVGGLTTGPVLDIAATDVDAFVAEINSQAGATIAEVVDGEIVITGADTATSIVTGGTAITGMVDADPSPDTVSLAEDGDHPFGFKLSTLSTSSSAISLTQPSGTPASLAVQFTGTPQAGETVLINLTLPDGTSHTIEFTASDDVPGSNAEFQIGATPEDTAANFTQAVEDELLRIGTTVLEAASVYEASDNFFNGQGETIMRVDGPPFESATALIAATESDTVSWYKGEDSANARQTVSARVDESTVVNYGIQANEGGMVQLLRSLAALTVEDYPSGDPTANERFSAMSTRQYDRLAESNNAAGGSIQRIGLELGIVSVTADNASDRHLKYGNQLDTMLADLELAPIEEVAVQLLSLKTRLQASYETMSMISQLSLVNYIR